MKNITKLVKQPKPSFSEEFKDPSSKGNSSKFDHDLFKDKDNIVLPTIRVKRIATPGNHEKWKVMHDNKIIFIIESSKISKSERLFLQTVEGFNFILSQAKTGIKSLNSFKNELKKVLPKKAENIAPSRRKRGRPRKNLQ
jgi:hypothetical protein